MQPLRYSKNCNAQMPERSSTLPLLILCLQVHIPVQEYVLFNKLLVILYDLLYIVRVPLEEIPIFELLRISGKNSHFFLVLSQNFFLYHIISLKLNILKKCYIYSFFKLIIGLHFMYVYL